MGYHTVISNEARQTNSQKIRPSQGYHWYLWFYIQNRDHALLMDLADGLQPRAVHGVLVAAVLEVLVVRDVLHHLVMGHKVVVLAVLLVLLRGSGRVCDGKNEENPVRTKGPKTGSDEQSVKEAAALMTSWVLVVAPHSPTASGIDSTVIQAVLRV